MRSEPAKSAILNQNYTQKLFIAFELAYSCCFSLRGNLDLLKKVEIINHR